jgi:hypothetical protein
VLGCISNTPLKQCESGRWTCLEGGFGVRKHGGPVVAVLGANEIDVWVSAASVGREALAIGLDIGRPIVVCISVCIRLE